jgi:hypothetical protein
MATDAAHIDKDSTRPASQRASAKINATKMTFVLSLLCLSILGYAAIAYVHFSFREPSGALAIPLFVVRQRTALSALAMTVAISCIIMGFAVFMIEAKGEIKFRAESSWVKGALATGVPGPFFVLCGTVITVAVLFARVTYEQGPVPTQGPPAASDSSGTVREVASRTIASSGLQRSALYTTQTAIYNDLMSIAVEDHPQDATKHLITNQEDISVVLIDWDDQNKRPISFQGSDVDNRNARKSVSEGYLFVLEGGAADSVKALLKAANGVDTNFPQGDHLPDGSVSKVIKAALNNRHVFSHGEIAP